MIVAGIYVSLLFLALVTSVLAVPAIWIPCAAIALLVALRLELAWALTKLVRVRPIRLDEGPRKRPRNA